MSKSIFREKNFMLIWIGSLVSQVGDEINSIAISIWVLLNTGSPIQMGQVYIFNKIAKLIFSVFSGSLVDTFNKKKVMYIADFARGLSALLIATVFLLKIDINSKMILLYVISAFNGIFDSLFKPASNSIIPEIIDQGMLMKANSVFRISGEILSIAASIFAASFVIIFGYIPSVIFNGISFIFSGITEMFIKYESKDKKVFQLSKQFGMLKEGFGYLIKQKKLLVITLSAGFINFATVPLFQNVIRFSFKGILNRKNIDQSNIFRLIKSYGTEKVVGNGLAFLSAVLAISISIGIIAGSLLILTNRMKKYRLHYTYIVSIMLIAISLFLFSYTLGPTPIGNAGLTSIVICISLGGIIYGMGSGIFNVSFISLIQMEVDKDFRGRFFSIKNVLIGMLDPLGVFIFAMLSQRYPLYYVYFLTNGAYLVVIAFAAAKYISKQIEPQSSDLACNHL